MASLTPKPGFNWLQVGWGGPDEPAAEECSYCGEPIPEETVPLILFRDDGWCARFCDACMVTWWGFMPQPPPNPDDDDWDVP
jgi:hypothetical protein